MSRYTAREHPLGTVIAIEVLVAESHQYSAPGPLGCLSWVLTCVSGDGAAGPRSRRGAGLCTLPGRPASPGCLVQGSR